MFQTMSKKIIFTYFLYLSFIAIGQNNFFKEGNKAYKEGKYQQAISLYEKALQSDKVSGELYFNLANAYYKTNQIAPSIYYYEKALQLLPDDEDVIYNLNLANQMKLDKIEKVPENIFTRFKKKINAVFSYNTWAWLTVISGLIGLIAFGFFLFSAGSSTKRISFTLIILSLFMLMFSWINAEYGKKQSQQKYAIVFVPKSDLLTEPNLTANKVIQLHEGTKVQVLKTEKDWYLVKLPDGKKAWLTKTDVRLLN